MTDEHSMEELMSAIPEGGLRKGERVSARVIEMTADGALVDVGQKNEGMIPYSEFSMFPAPPFRADESVPVIVKGMPHGNDHIHVSWKSARFQDRFPALEESQKNGTPLEALVLRAVKGGLVVDAGAEAFLPTSQIDLRHEKNVADWAGKTVTVVVTDLNYEKCNVVVSRRKLMEKEKAALRDQTLKALEVGKTYLGTVKSIVAYGAFIDIGGIEGLLHISDVSWGKTPKLAQVLKVGQPVNVRLLNYDEKTQKISLGLKQLLPHPWEDVPARFPVGSDVQGTVKSLASFGAFVSLADGVEGLIHSTEFTWKNPVGKISQYVKVGQSVTVRVAAVDLEQRKLSLSLKRVGGENPWETLKKQHPVGSRMRCKVTRIAPFGAFVTLPVEGLEGLVHVSDLSWASRPPKPESVLKPGEEVELAVRDVRPSEEKMSLSLKHLTKDPLTTYRKGKLLEGKVLRVAPSVVVIGLDDGLEGVVKGGEFDEKNLPPKVGERVGVKVVQADVRERRLELSIRGYDKEQEREAIRKYTRPERISLGELFGDGDDSDASKEESA